jgi:hypothetical protein
MSIHIKMEDALIEYMKKHNQKDKHIKYVY